ncbi:hypothetical protein [Palleronia abyssalis]|uniref:Uncharacterized protein n=1 Tax=Palleronia abyssalis TaxID=1501240 RepID=A0A2R8BS43_9RHOB|nr:hypothetical protein [Palleronia abyssalis]SPJ22951.1 hypothetical protein PAA8504_00752 [Palleronia abyssalis]
MIRPELLSQILRWREVLVGVGALAVGLWLALTSFGGTRWVGVVVAIGGIAIMREGIMRLRRPSDGGGAGVVNVTERQITYLSGTGGGAVSLDILSGVAVERDGRGGATWHLMDTEGRQVAIPADAEGARAIFDALAAIPGLSEEEAVAALKAEGRGRQTIWSKGPKRLS